MESWDFCPDGHCTVQVFHTLCALPAASVEDRCRLVALEQAAAHLDLSPQGALALVRIEWGHHWPRLPLAGIPLLLLTGRSLTQARTHVTIQCVPVPQLGRAPAARD